MREKRAAQVRCKLNVLDISAYFKKTKVKTRVIPKPVGLPTKRKAMAKKKKKSKKINEYSNLVNDIDTVGICFDTALNTTVSLVRGAIV